MSGCENRAAGGNLRLVLFVGAAIWGTNVGSGMAASDQRVWGPDPFGEPPVPVERASVGGPAVNAPPVELQGIIAGPTGMVAIIDANIVRIGDRIGAERVLEITPHAVVLQHGSQTRQLAISVLVSHGR